MTGPQGSDATSWQAAGRDLPAGGAEQPPAAPSWQQPDAPAPDPAWQPPAYPTAQYPQYGQPTPPPGYPPAQPYGPPAEYGAPVYGQPNPYAQPSPYGTQPQYGQYPPPPGQYPLPPGQPGPYGPYVPPGAEEASKKSARAIGGVLGALAAVVVLAVLLLGFWKPGFFVTTKLDVDKAQQGVQKVLTDESNGYGAKNVADVKCNNGQNPTVKKGDTFNCEVSIDGTKRQVTVTFQDDSGTYEVGRPK